MPNNVCSDSKVVLEEVQSVLREKAPLLIKKLSSWLPWSTSPEKRVNLKAGTIDGLALDQYERKLKDYRPSFSDSLFERTTNNFELLLLLYYYTQQILQIDPKKGIPAHLKKTLEKATDLELKLGQSWIGFEALKNQANQSYDKLYNVNPVDLRSASAPTTCTRLPNANENNSTYGQLTLSSISHVSSNKTTPPPIPSSLRHQWEKKDKPKLVELIQNCYQELRTTENKEAFQHMIKQLEHEFRQLSIKYHPDKQGEREVFQDVKEFIAEKINCLKQGRDPFAVGQTEKMVDSQWTKTELNDLFRIFAELKEFYQQQRQSQMGIRRGIEHVLKKAKEQNEEIDKLSQYFKRQHRELDVLANDFEAISKRVERLVGAVPTAPNENLPEPGGAHLDKTLRAPASTPLEGAASAGSAVSVSDFPPFSEEFFEDLNGNLTQEKFVKDPDDNLVEEKSENSSPRFRRRPYQTAVLLARAQNRPYGHEYLSAKAFIGERFEYYADSHNSAVICGSSYANQRSNDEHGVLDTSVVDYIYDRDGVRIGMSMA
ncbi:MAG: hypothetical protein WBE18_01225, partial [Gammaproteobacteria bacterium]